MPFVLRACCGGMCWPRERPATHAAAGAAARGVGGECWGRCWVSLRVVVGAGGVPARWRGRFWNDHGGVLGGFNPLRGAGAGAPMRRRHAAGATRRGLMRFLFFWFCGRRCWVSLTAWARFFAARRTHSRASSILADILSSILADIFRPPHLHAFVQGGFDDGKRAVTQFTDIVFGPRNNVHTRARFAEIPAQGAPRPPLRFAPMLSVRNHHQKIQVAALSHLPPGGGAEQHHPPRPRRLADAPRKVGDFPRPLPVRNCRLCRHAPIIRQADGKAGAWTRGEQRRSFTEGGCGSGGLTTGVVRHACRHRVTARGVLIWGV